jgi:hypothetical protein
VADDLSLRLFEVGLSRPLRDQVTEAGESDRDQQADYPTGKFCLADDDNAILDAVVASDLPPSNESYGGKTLRKAIDYFCHLSAAPEFYAQIKKMTAPSHRLIFSKR